jgi:hypothetical protein
MSCEVDMPLAQRGRGGLSRGRSKSLQWEEALCGKMGTRLGTLQGSRGYYGVSVYWRDTVEVRPLGHGSTGVT